MNLAVPGLTVYNWDEKGQQQVIALAEGDESRIAAFKRAVTEKRPDLAEVSDITVEPYEGDVGRTSELAMLCSFVQLDKAIPLLLRMDGKLEGIDGKLEKMDGSLQKIEENTGSIEGISKRIEKNTEKIIDNTHTIVDEVRGVRGDLVSNREWQIKKIGLHP